MTLVLLILAGLWAVVLLPPLLRARTEKTGDSIGDFNYRLDVLSRTNGRSSGGRAPRRSSGPAISPPVSLSPRALNAGSALNAGNSSNGMWSLRLGPPEPGSAAKRRRDVLRALLGAVTVTMLAAFVSGASVLWGLNLAADALLFGYLGLWAYVRSAQAERTQKLRYLPQHHPTPELALRRTASS